MFFSYIHIVPVFWDGPEKEPDGRFLQNFVGTTALVYVIYTKNIKIIIVFYAKKNQVGLLKSLVLWGVFLLEKCFVNQIYL